MNAVPSYTNAAGWARTPRCHKRNKGGRARGLRHPRQAGEGRVGSVRGRAAPKGKQTSRPTAVGRAGPQLRRPRTREGRRRPGTKGRGRRGAEPGRPPWGRAPLPDETPTETAKRPFPPRSAVGMKLSSRAPVPPIQNAARGEGTPARRCLSPPLRVSGAPGGFLLLRPPPEI